MRLLVGLIVVTAVVLLAADFRSPDSAHALGKILQVTTATDENNVGNGVCSLREAITAADNNSYAEDTCDASGSTGTDSIRFAIGNSTIYVATDLPQITAPLFINGDTGGAPRTGISRSGGNASRGLWVTSTAVNTTIDHVFVSGFSTGIQVDAANFTLTGSYLTANTLG
ncbi:MAG: CSLREA domain-containing protein, partial [Chloroflexota bacterium]